MVMEGGARVDKTKDTQRLFYGVLFKTNKRREKKAAASTRGICRPWRAA